MVKIDSYLSKEDHERLLKVCKAEGCTPYMLTKMALLDKIHNYSLKVGGSEQPVDTKIPGSTESTQEVNAVGVVETVKEIIERENV